MTLLIIEDEPEMLENMVQTLEREHYVVETDENYQCALFKIGAYDCRHIVDYSYQKCYCSWLKK